MTKKIENTFNRTMDEVEKYTKVYREGGKLEQAVAQEGGDITWFTDIRNALEDLMHALEEGVMSYSVATQESVTESKLTEGVLDADDEDGFMARSQLYFMAQDAIQLHGMIDDKENLEPWVQSKIAQAAQSIDAVRRYTEYNAMNDSMPMEDREWYSTYPDDGQEYLTGMPPVPRARPVKHKPGAFHDHMGDMPDSDDMKAAVARVFGNMKNSPDEFFKKRLGEEQIDEGKVATWALALLLGLGSYAGLEATSAKHTPLGQALEYAAEQGDKEAAKLYKNIDAYVDNDPQSLVNWRMSNEKIFDRFDESASLMEDGPNPLMRFLAPFVSGAGSDVYDQPHAGAWDSHSHDDEYADKPAEFMATRNTAADSVLKSLQKANPEKRYNIYQEILKNLTKPGGFVYEDETLMEHPLMKIIKNLMKKGDELGNKISDEDLAAATATAATLGGLGAATRPRRKDAETPDEFMRKRVGEGDYGKKKKKKKKKYYGEDIALPRSNSKGGSIYDMPKRAPRGPSVLDIKDANGVSKYLPYSGDGPGGGFTPNPDYTLAPGEKFDIKIDQDKLNPFKDTSKNPHMKPGLPSFDKPLRKKKDFIATEDIDAEWARVKATNNQIKINRFLSTLDQATAKRLTGNQAQLVKKVGKKMVDVDQPYTHDTNPAYADRAAKRKEGIPYKDIVTRMANEQEEDKKPYICVHAKKGKHECHAGSSYEAAKKAAAHWKLKSTAGIDAHLAVEEDVASYEDQYDDRIQVTVEKDKLLINGNPAQSYDWNSSAKDMVNPKFYARAKSWKELHGYLVRFLGNEEGMKNAIRQVFNTNEGNITVSEGMEFDEKRNDDLKTVAKDLFANAKAQAKKKAK